MKVHGLGVHSGFEGLDEEDQGIVPGIRQIAAEDQRAIGVAHWLVFESQQRFAGVEGQAKGQESQVFLMG